MLHASYYFSTIADLRSIQRVRMMLGVVHISDITSANGTRLDKQMLDTNVHQKVKNTYDWPSKHHVNAKDISIWRKLLNYIFPLETKSLPIPLGNWNTMTTEQWLNSWDFFITPNKEFLYQNHGNSIWSRFLLIPNSHRSYYTQPYNLHIAPSDVLERATVSLHNNRFIVASSSPPHTTSISTAPSLQFDKITLQQPKIKRFMNHLISTPITASLLYHILHGSAVGVSDGSYYPDTNVGACAWIVSTPDGSEYISGGGLLPGSPSEQNAYRSELGGQVGLAAFITALELPEESNPSITIACDGKSALSKINQPRMKVHCKDKQADLISILSDLWSNSPFSIVKQHVYGHQDEIGRPLTILEKLNCYMDQRAKQIANLQMLTNTNHVFSPTSLGFATIQHKKSIISSKIQQSLYASITRDNFLSWISSKPSFALDISQHDIHWPSFEHARKNTSIPINLFITKWISGFTASGKYMVRFKQRQHATCPGCPHPVEDLLHILTCPNKDTQAYRQDLLQDLKKWLHSSQTHPSIESFITKGLSQWFKTLHSFIPSKLPLYIIYQIFKIHYPSNRI